MATTIDIRDEVTPILLGLGARLTGAINPAIGAAVVDLFQQNFLSLGQNKDGYPSTNFWARAARATNYDVLADGVNINVNQQGVRQRLEGGPINAKPDSWLTIPARQEAYGKRAGEFSNLHFVFFRSGLAALVENDSTDVKFGRQKKDGTRTVTPGETRGGGIFYWLKKRVVQDGNPAVIPSETAITATVTETVRGIAERASQRGGVT